MSNRSYIKLVGNLTNVTGGTSGGTTIINNVQIPVLTRYISLGSWNMCHPNRGCTVPIPSDIPTCKIRSIDATIFSNGGDIYPLSFPDWTPSGRMHVNSACRCIELERNDGAFFTQSAFYGSITSRGRVGITYSNIKSPSGTTGIVSALSVTGFNVDNNVITDTGNSPICEYGVVYSQSTSNPTISSCKVCTVGNIAVDTPYCKSLSGLLAGTTTYFRMYAKNCEEVGYGVVKSCATLPISPITDVTVTVNRCSDFGIQTNGFIEFDQPLGAGQFVCLSLPYNQRVPDVGACGRVCILCKPNLGSFFNDITSTVDPSNCMCTDSVQFCRSSGGQLYIGYGDCICFINYSDGSTGSCSDFCITPYTSSVGLTVHMGACQEDCIANM